MVAQPLSLPSTSSPLKSSTSIGEKSQLSATNISERPSDSDSQPRCISLPSCLQPCQPVMEATKALAQKLLIRNRSSGGSLRRKLSRRLSQTPAEDDSPKVSRRLSRLLKQEDAVANQNASSEIPAPDAAADPPAATAVPAVQEPTNEVSSESSTVATEAPQAPSPGSDASPLSPATANPTTDGVDPEKPAIETPTSDYFTLANNETSEDVAPGKITFAIPSKESADGAFGSEPVSSSTPSTIVSPRDSVDEKLSSTVDDRRSSIVSSASQRSSTGSAARRWSTGLAFQSRSWLSKDLPPQELTPTLSST